MTEHDIVGPAIATEDIFGATCLTPATGATIRSLADLRPRTLGLMHGPSYTGDADQALQDLATAYDQRLATEGARFAIPHVPEPQVPSNRQSSERAFLQHVSLELGEMGSPALTCGRFRGTVQGHVARPGWWAAGSYSAERRSTEAEESLLMDGSAGARRPVGRPAFRSHRRDGVRLMTANALGASRLGRSTWWLGAGCSLLSRVVSIWVR